MAEGGYYPDDTGTFTGGDGETSEKARLTDHEKKEEMEMKEMGGVRKPPGTTRPPTSTSQSHHHNPSFVDETSSAAQQKVDEKLANRQELEKDVLEVYIQTLKKGYFPS